VKAAFTASPRESFSTTCVAKVDFAPGRPQVTFPTGHERSTVTPILGLGG